MTDDIIDWAEVCRIAPESEVKPWMVEAIGHPTKPDLHGRFAVMPDLTGYRWQFAMLVQEPS
jgi:hypothetical protein